MAEKVKINVRTVSMMCNEGDHPIPGGTEVTRDEFKAFRSAQIRMYGTIVEGPHDGEEVQVRLKKTTAGTPEFIALTSIIEREGTFECEGDLLEEEMILGVPQYYDPPLIRPNLTKDDGSKNFVYTPKPAPLWAKEFGVENWKTACINYGRDENILKGFTDERRKRSEAQREERKKARAKAAI